MDPIAFKLGERPVYWYGVMMAAAFLSAMIHWSILSRKEKRPAGFAADMAFGIMLSGIIGARIGYILGNLNYFAENPWQIIRLDQGGLVFYGGLIGCGLVVVIMAKRQKEPVWSMADFTVSPLPLGHALGRIGCFLNGCCYGIESDCRLAVHMQDAPRHPVQLYSVALNLILYLALVFFYQRKKRDGEVLMLYCLAYPVVRFLLEFLRGDPRVKFLHLTSAQFVSIAIFITGILLWRFLPTKLFRKRSSQCPKRS